MPYGQIADLKLTLCIKKQPKKNRKTF